MVCSKTTTEVSCSLLILKTIIFLILRPILKHFFKYYKLFPSPILTKITKKGDKDA